MIENPYKKYVTRNFKNYNGIETIKRLVKLGMDFFFSPQWKGLYILATQKFAERAYNLAIGTPYRRRTSPVAKLGRLAIKDI